MDFVVEDGTGLANSNSYVSVADAIKYHDSMGNAAWAEAGESEQMIALIRASTYLDGRYASSWPGTRLLSTQRMDWPREDAYDIDDFDLLLVPLAVQEATCEAALIELASLGALSEPLENAGQVISERLEGVVTVQYANMLQAGTSYPAIGRKLRRIVSSSAMREVLK